MAVNDVVDIETQERGLDKQREKSTMSSKTGSTLQRRFFQFCVLSGLVLCSLYLSEWGSLAISGDGSTVELRNQTEVYTKLPAAPKDVVIPGTVERVEPLPILEDSVTADKPTPVKQEPLPAPEAKTDEQEVETAPELSPLVAATQPALATPVDTNHDNKLPQLSKEEILSNPRDLYASRPIPVDYQGENLARIAGMKKLFQQAHEKHRQFLRTMYGDYTDQLFPTSRAFGTSVLSSVRALDGANRYNTSPYSSMGRVHFIDKLKLKLVQVQLKYLQSLGTSEPDTTLSRFVHMHGGHSSGAGHGNFFRESYTAVMERHLQPIFQSIGIHYIGRNMAAGGTSGADEVALCSNSYFGKDIDLQSWDYGMTDGKNRDRQYIFAWRIAALSQLPPLSDDINDIPSRPAFMVIHYNSGSVSSFADMETRNLTAVALNEGTRQQLSILIPDSELLSEAEIDQLPPFLRLFRCGSALETQGRCGAEKYNMTDCAARQHMAKWHPGHKSHALDGTLMAVGVISALEEAMDQLAELEPADESREDAMVRLTELFRTLNDAEQQRYNSFINSDIPIEKGRRKGVDWLKAMEDVVTYKDILTSPNFCHIAKLPSDQRFRGLVTENFRMTTINPAIERNFDMGFNKGILSEEESRQIDPMVRTNPEPRQDELLLASVGLEACPLGTFLDGRDVFYTSSVHDWLHLTLPNDSEQRFYSEFDVQKSKGWILVCFGVCSWGKCKPDDVQPDNASVDPRAGHLEMEVNGVPVDSYDQTGLGCHFLSHNSTDRSLRYNWKPNEAGKYKIRVRVAGAETFGRIEFSSFIFY